MKGPECRFSVKMINSIQASVRLQWTLTEFYAAGGSTSFVDRLAASLGIHASTIKIVSVWEGSVNVEYGIVSATGDDAELQQIKTILTNKLKNDEIDFGAPVLSNTIQTEDIPINDNSTNNGG